MADVVEQEVVAPVAAEMVEGMAVGMVGAGKVVEEEPVMLELAQQWCPRELRTPVSPEVIALRILREPMLQIRLALFFACSFDLLVCIFFEYDAKFAG
jgi:hypothetical protein